MPQVWSQSGLTRHLMETQLSGPWYRAPTSEASQGGRGACPRVSECSLGTGRSQENHLKNPKRGIGSSQLLPEQDKRRPRLRFFMQAWNSVAHSDRPDREGRRDARISKPRKDNLTFPEINSEIGRAHV